MLEILFKNIQIFFHKKFTKHNPNVNFAIVKVEILYLIF